MPSYMYQITFRGQTKALHIRKSNPKGWVGQIVQEAFPELAVSEPNLFSRIIRADLVPDVAPHGRWHLLCEENASGFSLHVTEMKGK